MINYRTARRIVVGIVGGTVLAAGLAMTVLPGPAVVVIPVGLGILALEFAWARRWLRRLRDTAGMGPAEQEPSSAPPPAPHAPDSSPAARTH